MDNEPIHKPSPGPDINFVYNKTAKLRHHKIVVTTVILLVIANAGVFALSRYFYNNIADLVKSLPAKYIHRPSTGSGQSAGTADWKTYRNDQYGFEFKYPSTFIQSPTADSAGNISIEGKEGHIVVSVINLKLDSNDIEGLYGKIDKPELVKINNIQWYKFGFGDAGCGGPTLQTGSSNHIIQLAFISCDSDKDPILSDNSTIIDQILSTFKFTESKNPEFCAQVITRAKNPQTGEIKNFPTPCDVPTGWVKI